MLLLSSGYMDDHGLLISYLMRVEEVISDVDV